MHDILFAPEVLAQLNGGTRLIGSTVVQVVCPRIQHRPWPVSCLSLCYIVLPLQYYDIVVTVEPKRLALAEANDQLNEANST